MKITVDKAYRIDCEYCGDYLMDALKSVVVKQAKENGWHIYKGENCCPRCYKSFKKDK